MSFSSQVKKGADNYIIDAMKIVSKSFDETSKKIVRDTAVDTGKLRNNWTASFISPATSVNRPSDGYAGTGAFEEGKKQKTKGVDSLKSIDEVVKSINAGKVGQTINLTNCQPYAVKMEIGGYKSAPKGFLITNVMSAGKTYK